MAKIIKNSKLDVDKLAELKSELVFLPSPVHRSAKTKFWARYDSLLDGSGTPSKAEAIQLTGEPKLAKWWYLPGFKEWFLNQDEARERLEYLYMLALDAAEQVLLDPEAQANARVQMIKVIASLAGKEPTKQVQYIDQDIQLMDTEKLRAYIEKHAPRLVTPANSEGDGEDEPDS